MQRTLTLEQSPPMSAVLRFFLSTPLFALAAGALLLWEGAPALASRWSPATLALTHLFTLGALGMTMAGALIQILPVVAGTLLPRAELLARGVHLLLGFGTAALAAAFMTSSPWLFQLALAALVAGFAWLVGAVTVGLWQPAAPGAAPMLATVRLALAALVVTVALGAVLAGAFGWPDAGPLLPLVLATDLHARWGVFGWAGLLLAGVAFQVVPMFQVTALYPSVLMRWLGIAVFVLLAGSSIVAAAMGARAALDGLVLAGYALFAVVTLQLLARRTRPEADAMTLFWRLAMACLLACAVLWAIPDALAGQGKALAMGVLAIVGFLYSTINGMLYKIVPFLMWRELQQHAPAGYRAPPVKHILPDRVAQRQFWLHAAALALLTAACWRPAELARPAALALCASSAWLCFNLARAARAQLQER